MPLTLGKITLDEAQREIITRERARRSLLPFMRYCWRGGHTMPFKSGPQIVGMCAELDKAILRFKQGKSTFMIFRVVFRHSKSETSSRYFPAYALGHLWHRDPDIMVVGCDDDLAIGFSRDTQSIMEQESYQRLFPGVRVHPTLNSAGMWKCTGRHGYERAIGFGGKAMGRGATILIFDDWAGSRADAESLTMRNKVWDAFRNDLMTRRADPCIVIVVGTPWHVDGLQCRILREMESSKDFPRFEMRSFPARSKGPDGQWVYLWPEKFSETWYKEQYAMLTRYESAGLMDCDPVAASGNLASRKDFKIVPSHAGPFKRVVRYWDTAATVKSTSDYTSAVKIGILESGEEFILDILYRRISAVEVGDAMLATAQLDGWDCEQWLECEKGSMGLIGPAELAKAMLSSRYDVRLAYRPHGSKLSVWLPFFGYAHKGLVGVVDGPNVETFLKHVDAAPDSDHDDDLDAAAGAHRALHGMIESESATGGLGGMIME